MPKIRVLLADDHLVVAEGFRALLGDTFDLVGTVAEAKGTGSAVALGEHHVVEGAGAGGVGMAAVQIARHLGAEVIASAGSPAKRALLERLGVKHVIDSRRGDFAEAVMSLTERRGVDVVLNALAGEAIPMGLSCLTEFGRFVEIGKRDIYQNSRIPLWPLRRNASFHVVAMDAVFARNESLTREMLAELARHLTVGETHFFRHARQLEWVADHLARRADRTGRAAAWSALSHLTGLNRNSG